jgi:NitT/TauT family transport system permease protein
VLISELFGARSGLGYLMLQSEAVGDVTSVLATCLTIVMLFALGEGTLINPIGRSVRRDLAAKER